MVFICLGPVLFAAAVFFSVRAYRPPFLDGESFNPLGRVYDFLAYGWHYSRAVWLENQGLDLAARKESARAAWRRPSRAGELIGVGPDDLFELAAAYASLNLTDEAVFLFRAALPAALPDEEASLEIISYLAILGDWDGASAAVKELLEVKPASTEAAYWRERSLLEAGRPAGSRAYPEYDGLTPPITRPVTYENKLILLGYEPPPAEVETAGRIEVGLYLRGWRFRPLELIAEFSLVPEGEQQEIFYRSEPFTVPSAGETAREVVSTNLPFVLYPGKVSLRVAFRDIRSGKRLKSNSHDKEYYPLGEFNLTPAWREVSPRRGLVEERFGKGSRPLGRSVFLGPGSEVELEFTGEERVRALGLISYGHSSFSLPQGGLLGRLTLRTGEEGELVFPVTAGVETAEVWWENPPPLGRKHGPAPVFRSWPAVSGGEEFEAREYYAVFRLPRPLTLKSLRFENLSRRSGWHISDIVIVPSTSAPF